MNINLELKSAYEEEYFQTLKRAKAELSDTAFDIVSTVQPLYLHDSYWSAPLRVMVMGQETYDNERPLKDLPFDDDQALRNQFDAEIEHSKAFDFAYGTEKEGVPFWKAFQEVVFTVISPCDERVRFS